MENSSTPVSRFFLENQLVSYFDTPVEDLWFLATEQNYFNASRFNLGASGNSTLAYYVNTFPRNVRGCVEQIQFWYISAIVDPVAESVLIVQ